MSSIRIRIVCSSVVIEKQHIKPLELQVAVIMSLLMSAEKPFVAEHWILSQVEEDSQTHKPAII